MYNTYHQPLIYIAAMPRSGSTMLAGMLSRDDHSLILSEPGFQRGLVKHIGQLEDDVEKKNIDALGKHKGNPSKLVKAFRSKIVPSLAKKYKHIGLKECFLENWSLFEKHFKEVRYIVLARNPHDIYLSIEDYASNVDWFKEMWIDKGLDYISSILNDIWQKQQEIINNRMCLKIRYEDLCSGVLEFNTLAEYLDLDFYEPGTTSQKYKYHSWRKWETDKHGDGVSNKSVYRWKAEKDIERRKKASVFAGNMQDYCYYWGYDCS